MKPERIQIAPPLGGDDHDPEQDWKATVSVSRTFELEPTLQVAFLAGVLPHAQSLPVPPKIVCEIAANTSKGGYRTSVCLQWIDNGPMTDVEIDFAHWVSGFHENLTIEPMVIN